MLKYWLFLGDRTPKFHSLLKRNMDIHILNIFHIFA